MTEKKQSAKVATKDIIAKVATCVYDRPAEGAATLYDVDPGYVFSPKKFDPKDYPDPEMAKNFHGVQAELLGVLAFVKKSDCVGE